jgi:hypothetical protein
MSIDRMGWKNFIPDWMTVAPKETLILFAGIFCIILAIGFFSGFFLRTISFVSFLYFFGILILYGVNDMTFHDFGLMMMSLSALLLSQESKQKNA